MSERELENRIEQLEAQLAEIHKSKNVDQSTNDELTLDEKLDLISYIVAENGKDTVFIKWFLMGALAAWGTRAVLTYFSIL